MQTHPSGTRIDGRYEVVGRPLVGGMGIVYFCFDHQEQRPVALKTFKPENLSDRDARARFLVEGHAWLRLGKHPHIVGERLLEVTGLLGLGMAFTGLRDAQEAIGCYEQIREIELQSSDLLGQ